jgi:hypothetical protein
MATKIKTFGTANAPAATPPQRRLIAPKQLPDKGILYNMNYLRRMWNDGRFPPPIHLSPRRLVWDERVIDAWIASKMEAA